jgi:hypothetical protein
MVTSPLIGTTSAKQKEGGDKLANERPSDSSEENCVSSNCRIRYLPPEQAYRTDQVIPLFVDYPVVWLFGGDLIRQQLCIIRL